jgi:hypothetical protein
MIEEFTIQGESNTTLPGVIFKQISDKSDDKTSVDLNLFQDYHYGPKKMTSNTVTANTAQVLKCSRKVSKSCRSRA